MLEFLSTEAIEPTVRAVLLGRPRILLVEDDDDLAYGLEIILGRSYEVAVAATAREAVELHGRISPDVLIVDYHLPDSNGIRLLESLKRHFAYVPPAIMLSAYGARRDASELAGFDTFLEKPCLPTRLLGAIERSIRSV